MRKPNRATAAPPAGQKEAAPAKAASQDSVWETIKTIFYAVLIALVVRTVAFEPFNIPSRSMLPTLLVGDYLFVSKYSYGYSRYSFSQFGISLPFSFGGDTGRILYHPVKRGDVVVFKLPRDNKTDFIKRIVGLPGDRIQMINGILNINGEPVKRQEIADFMDDRGDGQFVRYHQYIETLPNGVQHRILERSDEEIADNTGVYVVPPNNYFAMGDNRDNSLDSRIPPAAGGVGFVPAANLVGRAEFLFFSIDENVHLWEFWQWPSAIRFSRIFTSVD
ncbi:MAG: signal peptidase I [Candidatus Eiseniibacteriota bacterium]